MQLHERPAQVRMPDLANARIWSLLQGPCWCQGTPAESSSFGLSRHRSVDLGEFDRHILVVSNRLMDGSLPTLRRLYAETPDPKLVVAAATCPATEEFWDDIQGGWTPIEEILDVDIAVEECIFGYPESLLAAVFDHVGSGMTPRSVLSTSEGVEN